MSSRSPVPSPRIALSPGPHTSLVDKICFSLHKNIRSRLRGNLYIFRLEEKPSFRNISPKVFPKITHSTFFFFAFELKLSFFSLFFFDFTSFYVLQKYKTFNYFFPLNDFFFWGRGMRTRDF